MKFRPILTFVFTWIIAVTAFAGDVPKVLPNTAPLTLEEPLDEVMVAGINRFALRKIEASKTSRSLKWKYSYDSVAAYEKSVADNRTRFGEIIGAVDKRVDALGFEVIATNQQRMAGKTALAESANCEIVEVRWRVLEGVTGEGLLISPKDKTPTAFLVALPDADTSPEEFCGLTKEKLAFSIPLQMAAQGIQVLVPTLINRDDKFSGHPDVTFTNIPHREFVYRTSFEVGRHPIGYEVQKVLAAVDNFAATKSATSSDIPIGVLGVGEGGLIALYSAAIDTRIDATLVCGYFSERENLWREPIYRNVWRILAEFGDAEIASLIAPRSLTIEASRAPEIEGPPTVRPGRRACAAPGEIRTPEITAVKREYERARHHFRQLELPEKIQLVVNKEGVGPAGGYASLSMLLDGLKLVTKFKRVPPIELLRSPNNSVNRQKRQIDELVNFSHKLVRRSALVRDQKWRSVQRKSVEAWVETVKPLRDEFYDEVIGRLPAPTMPPNPRTRLISIEEKFVVYEVMLDVFPDVIAGGLLLLPTDIEPGEKRPVVVCQHGLEGLAAGTLTTRSDRFLKRGFAAELAERGFVVYAPQNPYRGKDRFRTIQRKSNPLGLSLFSYIIPQHQRTLNWLATLPEVDSKRIGFYGISYGGKTAMRVPPFLPDYSLAICSADFNEWIKKTTSTTYRSSYVFTGEYEIWEWNMAHHANYAELASMMTPRPFMVERGHRDGVAPDEWVAWEYAKVRRHYDEIGIGDRTEIEFFNGPHTIHGRGTFEFLHRHLKHHAPEPEE